MDTAYPARSAADGDIALDPSPTAAWDAEADAILEADAQPSLRRQVRQDAAAARQWGARRAERARLAVVQHPREATVWALGLGVVIGLLLRR